LEKEGWLHGATDIRLKVQSGVVVNNVGVKDVKGDDIPSWFSILFSRMVDFADEDDTVRSYLEDRLVARY
jgi:hypothetical protein